MPWSIQHQPAALSVCSRYGITGRLQTSKIGQLSEGQKSRLIFAMMCMKVSLDLLASWGINQCYVCVRCMLWPCRNVKALPDAVRPES